MVKRCDLMIAAGKRTVTGKLCQMLNTLLLEEFNPPEIERKDYVSFCWTMLIVIPPFVMMQYGYMSYIHHKGQNLITLTVTSSDSPEVLQESSENGGSHTTYLLKAQDFNCHFWIVGEPLKIITGSRKAMELLETIQRGDSLTLVISEEDENQLGSLYYNARLFGLAKHDDILFSPGQLSVLQKDYMRSTLKVAAIFEFVALLGLIWSRIRLSRK
jgi:hypothetical protein